MRYMMKQRLFTWGDTFIIKDAREQDVFQVHGKVFSIGHQLAFWDMAGNELAYIKQRLLTLSPTYEIYRSGTLYAVIHKELFILFTSKFIIEMPGPCQLVVEGDYTNHEYTFTRDDQVIASVSKAWFTWAETYGVDVADEEDAPLILACTVAIEQSCRDNNT